MKLTWLTDIHLNFIDLNTRKKFYKSITNNNTDAILISGDIAEAPSVCSILVEMFQYIKTDIYFVLGNHDYYRGDIAGLRKEISNLCNKYTQLHWLPKYKGTKLTEKVVLVGDDCWADGRYGNYSNSRVMLNDSLMIKELYEARICGKYQILDKMQKLSDSDAERLKKEFILCLIV